MRGAATSRSTTIGRRPLRVLAAGGPGDVLGTFERWMRGEEDTRIAHVAFSKQFFDACRDLDVPALVLSTHERLGKASHGSITVEHVGALVSGHGLGYHLSHVRAAHRIARRARAFGANVIFTGMTPYPFLLRPLLPPSTKMVAELHNTLWSEEEVTRPKTRVLAAAHGLFFRWGCDGIMAVSETIKRQVRATAGPAPAPFVDFLPLLPAGSLDTVAPPREGDGFRVFFAGRIERDKGVFDLLEVATRLAKDGNETVFELCGSGGALDELRAEAAKRGLQQSFLTHGWCGRDELRTILGRSSVVVVPTRRSFAEGFNMVVVEALLAGRPVVTSRVCPALEYVRDAAYEVEPDDPASYYEAIAKLRSEPALYDRLRTASRPSGQRFLDPERSYGAAVRWVLEALARDSRPVPRELS